MTQEDIQLDYFISVKLPAAVICFVGSMTKQTLPQIKACSEELIHTDAKYFIFSFRDVDKVDRTVYGELIRMFKGLRDNGKLYCAASVHPKIRGGLIDGAVIRHSEITNNLKNALEGIEFLRAA